MLTKKYVKNGFTMVEALLALFITSILSFCMVVLLQTYLACIKFRPTHQDQMAIIQLRFLASISNNLHVEQDKLIMIYENQEIELSFDRNRLVRKDGYEIMMENIEYAYFKEGEQGITLFYKKFNKEYEIQIN